MLAIMKTAFKYFLWTEPVRWMSKYYWVLYW